MSNNRFTLSDHHRELAEIAFGDNVDRVYSDREFAFEVLKSSSWQQRYSSLSLLHHHWQIDAEIITPICKLVCENDEHIQVRLNALRVLGSLFEYTFDSAISSYLARIVLDESCPTRVRRSACESIEKIRTEQPIPSQFVNVEDLYEKVGKMRAKFDDFKNQDPDELPEFDRGLIEELARDE